jgi:colanic acid/amylovoran biosynthesis glycosyltransferase
MSGASVVYLVSRFPKTTESFIANELVELRRRGYAVHVRSLIRPDDEVLHPGVQELLPSVQYRPGLLRLAADQLAWLRRRPRTLVALWWEVIAYQWRHPGELAKYAVQLLTAASWARSLPEGHIHAHWATYPAFGAMAIRDLTDRPFTLTCHAHDIQVNNDRLERKLLAAARVVTISEHNRRDLNRRFPSLPPGHIVIVHCGVNVAALQPPMDTALHAPPTVVCVGGLVPYKGQRHLIDAITELHRRGRPVSLRLIGEGSDRHDLEARIAQSPAKESITLLGQLPGNQVRSELSAADVFVLPSVLLPSGQTEGIPVALMEAMACERPVISSPLSGIPELVIDGETGLLVEPERPSLLADAIERLCDDEALRRRLGIAARVKVIADFEFSATIDQLEHVFAGVADTSTMPFESAATDR